MSSRSESTGTREARTGSADVIEEVVQTDDDETVYVAHHDVRTDGLTVTLALALSAVTGRAPTDIVPTFSKYADPDALDRLFRPLPNGDLREGGPMHLHVQGCDVAIHSTGRIEITA